MSEHIHMVSTTSLFLPTYLLVYKSCPLQAKLKPVRLAWHGIAWSLATRIILSYPDAKLPEHQLPSTSVMPLYSLWNMFKIQTVTPPHFQVKSPFLVAGWVFSMYLKVLRWTIDHFPEYMYCIPQPNNIWDQHGKWQRLAALFFGSVPLPAPFLSLCSVSVFSSSAAAAVQPPPSASYKPELATTWGANSQNKSDFLSTFAIKASNWDSNF